MRESPPISGNEFGTIFLKNYNNNNIHYYRGSASLDSTGRFQSVSFGTASGTLGDTEFVNLQGQDQALKTTDSPSFAEVTINSIPASQWLYNQTNGAGSTVYVPYTGATQNVNLGIYNLTTTGKVGIGTTSPIGALDVVGDIYFRNGVDALIFKKNATSVWDIGFGENSNNSNNIAIRFDGSGTGDTGNSFQIFDFLTSTPRLTVQRGGNTGIGTTTPTSKLEINGSGVLLNIKNDSNSFLFVNESNGRVGIGTTSPASFFQIGSNTVAQQWSSTINPQVLIQGVDNEAIVPAISIMDENLNEYFRVSSTGTGNSDTGKVFISGNLGLGTSTPTSKLEVNGSGALLNIKNDSDSFLFVNETNRRIDSVGIIRANRDSAYKGIQYLQLDGGDSGSIRLTALSSSSNDKPFFIQSVTSTTSTSSNSISFRNGISSSPITRLFIDYQGFIGIGTSTPTSKLEVNGTGDLLKIRNDSTIFFFVNGTSGGIATGASSKAGTEITVGDTGGDANSIIDFTATTGRFRIGGANFFSASSSQVAFDSPIYLFRNSTAHEKMKITQSGFIFNMSNGVGSIFNVQNDSTSFLFVNETSGRVGIGTTNPDVSVHIINPNAEILRLQRSGSASNVVMSFNNTAGATSIGRPPSASFSISPSPTLTTGTYFWIDSTGLVGIGTSIPTSKLEINGSGTLLNIKNDSTSFLFVNETSGRVGIGTTSPTSGIGLHVIGGIYSANPIYTTSISSAWISSTSNFNLAYGSLANLTFASGTINKMRLTNAGSLGVNTIVPSATLDVNGSTNIAQNLVVGGNFSAKRAFWYGYDNSTQNFPDTAVAKVLNVSNNNDIASFQIMVEGNQNVTFQSTGEYLMAVSPEFYQASGGTALATFYIQKTDDAGTTFRDVAWSNSRYTIPNGNYHAPTIEWGITINDSRQKVRVMWWSDNTNTQIYSSGALTSPTRPSIPGVIMNIRKSSALV